MKILQFGFSDEATNGYLPHNFDRNCIVYTGSHDNDTTAGWYRSADEKTRASTVRYLGTDDVPWGMIRLAMASIADVAIVPAQDLLGLGAEARMNSPGKAVGNWFWRLLPGQLQSDLAGRLLHPALTYGRYA